MTVAPISSHESARLAALHRLQLLNTGSEPAFDELAQLATYVCRTPIAVISLVDASRQWFKAVIGLPFTESPRSIAFCAHTILMRDLFIVEEADADERFHDHPWVIEPPAVRFYAGVPLLARDGHAIGSLAVMDVVPRSLTPEQRAAMQTLARQVMAQCELRERSVLQPAGARVDGLKHPQVEEVLRSSEERFRLVAEATNDILWDWDLVTQEHWWSPNAREKFGYDPNAEPSITAWTDRLHPDDRDRVMAIVDHALASETRTVTAEYRFRLADGSYGHFYDRGQIVRDSSGRPRRMIGAMIDVTFSTRAFASLEAAYERLQSLSRELQTVEANERRRLSRELHDEVGQLLTALKFDLAAARQALADKHPAAIERAQERAARALETTDELFARLRRIVRALRPPVLEELGLREALEAMVSDIQSHSDLVCAVSIEGEVVDSVEAGPVETALYRIAQELATNVARHAQAMTLTVILDTDGRQWMLTVQDDGIGFDPKSESISGMGIRGVRERAEILGGRVAVSSMPGAGTTVTVWIPMRPPNGSGEGPHAR